MSQQCCAVDNACANDQNCVALLGCLMQCGPPSPDGGTQCPDMCAQQYMQGLAEFDAIGNCLTGPCGAACSGP